MRRHNKIPRYRVREISTSNEREKPHVIKTVSYISQIVVAITAVFGYFYTVRPFYQNQLLTEKNAKLESQYAQSNSLLNSQRDELDKIKGLIELREAEASRLLENISSMKKSMQQIEHRNFLLEQQLAKSEKRSAELSDLIIAKQQRVDLFENSIHLKYLIHRLYSYSSSWTAGFLISWFSNALSRKNEPDQLDTIQPSDIDGYINKYFGDPYSSVYSALEKIYGEKIDLEYIDPNKLKGMASDAMQFLSSNRDRFKVNKGIYIDARLFLNNYIRDRDLLREKEEIAKARKDYQDSLLTIREKSNLKMRIISELDSLQRKALGTSEIVNEISKFFHAKSPGLYIFDF